MRKALILLGVLLGTVDLRAQEAVALNDTLKKTDVWEFTSNITLALSRFSGNTTRNLNDDPYLMMVRRVNLKNQSAWRIGVNGFRRKSDDFNGGFTRESNENSASLVIGREWRKDLGSGLYCYWGTDLRGIWRQNRSVSQQFDQFGMPTQMVTNAQDFGGSVGGLGGMAWTFRDRITLYTESIIYLQYVNTKREFIVNNNTTTLENKNVTSVLPLVPIALFLTVRL